MDVVKVPIPRNVDVVEVPIPRNVDVVEIHIPGNTRPNIASLAHSSTDNDHEDCLDVEDDANGLAWQKFT